MAEIRQKEKVMRKILLAFFFAITLFSCGNKTVLGIKTSTLHFANGKFRIAQFTDLHWEDNDSLNAANRKLIIEAVKAEKPQLCVLTGDIVTGGDAEKGWKDIIAIMESMKTPYLILMGNHDPENLSIDSIYGLIDEYGPNYAVGTNDEHFDGFENGVLTILGENTDSVKGAVYFFNSGSSYKDRSLSEYDNIHFNQVSWYMNKSDNLTKRDEGVPLPAIAYFHISLPEYKQLAEDTTKIFGHRGEGCSSSEINSGLFSAMLERGDIMGTFVGHDHSCDFIGLWKGVALGYGRCSGARDNNDVTPSGCRIVELTEGKRSFETWIWTPRGEEGKFYYPSGINEDMEKEGNYLKAQNIDASLLVNGINYTFYEGTENELSTDAMIKNGTLKEQGILDSITIKHAKAEDHFGYNFEGFFKAETKGVYLFTINSDDGAKLFVDDKCIINNDGSHSLVPSENYIALDKGFHKFQLQYFEDYMGQHLELFLTTKNKNKMPLPARLIYTNSGKGKVSK